LDEQISERTGNRFESLPLAGSFRGDGMIEYQVPIVALVITMTGDAEPTAFILLHFLGGVLLRLAHGILASINRIVTESLFSRSTHTRLNLIVSMIVSAAILDPESDVRIPINAAQLT